jgi:hypothetical protein
MIEIISILAILLAPIIALRVSKRLDENKSARNRKMFIFTTLMAKRATGLSPEFVEALNRIDVEFYGGDDKSKMVVEAWRLYHDHLSNTPGTKINEVSGIDPTKPINEEEWKIWSTKREDLLTELLYQMAVYLGFKFDKVNLKRGHYFPRAYGDLEDEQTIIRKGLVDIFKKKAPFPVLAFIVSPPPGKGKEEDMAKIQSVI